MSASNSYSSFVVYGEQEDAYVRTASSDLVSGLEPGEPWHRHVEDGEVDELSASKIHRFGTVSGLGNNFKIRLCIEYEPDAAAHYSVIITEQYPSLHGDGNRGRPLPPEAVTAPRGGRVPQSALPCRRLAAD